MFICDADFLSSLVCKTEDQRLAVIERLLQGLEVNPQRVRVLVLADLHLEEGDSFRTRMEESLGRFGMEESRTDLHALVVAGDLVAGNSIKWGSAKSSIPMANCHDELSRLHLAAGTDIAGAVTGHRVLVVPGNHDVVRVGGDPQRRSEIKEMLGHKGPHQGSSFLKNVQEPLLKNGSTGGDAAALKDTPRLLLLGGEYGVIAIIGLDSNHMAYEAPGLEYPGYINDNQLANVGELVDALKKVFKDRPLFLWAVWHHHLLPVYSSQINQLIGKAKASDPSLNDMLRIFDAITIDGRAVVDKLCEERFSLATHGHMHAPCIQRVSYKPRSTQILNVVACPSCKAKPDDEHPYVGATLVDIDFERGLAEVSIKGVERLPNGLCSYTTRDIYDTYAIPLVSASRVTLGEMRLYRHLKVWLWENEQGRGGLGVFSGKLPRPPAMSGLNVENDWWRSVNNCLGETGYVPICMGSPDDVIKEGLLTREQLATLPKKKYRLLLALRDSGMGDPFILLNQFSPIRLSDYGSWDVPLLPAFRSIHGLVDRWLRDARRLLDEYRRKERKGDSVADHVTRLENILDQLAKVQESDEELVTISSPRLFLKFSPTDGVPVLYEYSLTHWPRLASNQSSDLLWFLDEYVSRMDSSEVARTLFRDYRPGLLWLPLSSWKDSKGIKARNGDVMQWVDETLEGLKGGMPELPRWLVLRSGGKLEVGGSKVDVRSFGDGSLGRESLGGPEDGVASSLVHGLDRVTMAKDGEGIYRGKEICAGKLKMVREGNRIGINVHRESGELLGHLRPVQRYVLDYGLERAKELRKNVSDKFGKDVIDLGRCNELGYLRLSLAGGRDISVLPLIVEQIASEDQEGGTPEFILCDGNHRLVQHLLIDGCDSLGCAIVLGEPVQPYYAWPYSRLDWGIVMQNQLASTPDMYSKYTPRYPWDWTQEQIRQAPESYRLLFRDLSTGFGDVGAQGGRLV